MTYLKCICKSWYALIKIHSFITDHHVNNKTNFGTDHLISEYDKTVQYSIFSSRSPTTLVDSAAYASAIKHIEFTEKMEAAMRVVDCCNGIFCLFESCDKTFLWNPATREVKALPESNITKEKGLQSHTFMHVGIGFDPNTNDIKVIRNVGSKFGDKFEIYTLSTDSWRVLILGDNFMMFLKL